MPTRREVVARLTSQGQFELVQDSSLGPTIKIYKNAPATMRTILESTRQFDERVFLVYGDETISFKEHFGKVAALAHFLRVAGVEQGDRVAIGMRNYPEWMMSFWACQAIGAVAVALNAWWTGPEIAFALEDSGACALLVDGERLERLAPVLVDASLKTLVVARRNAAGRAGVDFDEATSRIVDALPPAEIAPADFSTILYTSGTTG